MAYALTEGATATAAAACSSSRTLLPSSVVRVLFPSVQTQRNSVAPKSAFAKSFPRLCLSVIAAQNNRRLSYFARTRVSVSSETGVNQEQGGDVGEEQGQEQDDILPENDNSDENYNILRGNDDSSAAAGSEGFKVFVGNLPFSVDSAQLAELFQEAGEVNMVEVIYDRATGRSRGFGFVTMALREGADAAVEKFHGFELQGRALRVNAGPPPPRERGGFRNEFGIGERSGSNFMDSPNRLFVGNLPWAADQLSLEQLFGDYGNVLEAKVVYDRETGRSRGFGFVTMSSAEEVEQAISSLNGMDLDGRQIRVEACDARRPRF